MFRRVRSFTSATRHSSGTLLGVVRSASIYSMTRSTTFFRRENCLFLDLVIFEADKANKNRRAIFHFVSWLIKVSANPLQVNFIVVHSDPKKFCIWWIAAGSHKWTSPFVTNWPGSGKPISSATVDKKVSVIVTVKGWWFLCDKPWCSLFSGNTMMPLTGTSKYRQLIGAESVWCIAKVKPLGTEPCWSRALL